MKLRVLTKEAMGMKIGKFSILLILISVSILIITACTPSRVLVEEYNQVSGETATMEPETAEEIQPEPGEVQEPAPVDEDQEIGRDDVPIMDSGYRIQKGRSGENIVYHVDATIEEVLTYYQEELPNYDWEMAGPPDNAISAIATMLRENADGDRLAINMQANELGGFVIITITISRAN
jgi:hypothetical protein